MKSLSVLVLLAVMLQSSMAIHYYLNGDTYQDLPECLGQGRFRSSEGDTAWYNQRAHKQQTKLTTGLFFYFNTDTTVRFRVREGFSDQSIDWECYQGETTTFTFKYEGCQPLEGVVCNNEKVEETDTCHRADNGNLLFVECERYNQYVTAVGNFDKNVKRFLEFNNGYAPITAGHQGYDVGIASSHEDNLYVLGQLSSTTDITEKTVTINGEDISYGDNDTFIIFKSGIGMYYYYEVSLGNSLDNGGFPDSSELYKKDFIISIEYPGFISATHVMTFTLCWEVEFGTYIQNGETKEVDCWDGSKAEYTCSNDRPLKGEYKGEGCPAVDSETLLSIETDSQSREVLSVDYPFEDTNSITVFVFGEIASARYTYDSKITSNFGSSLIQNSLKSGFRLPTNFGKLVIVLRRNNREVARRSFDSGDSCFLKGNNTIPFFNGEKTSLQGEGIEYICLLDFKKVTIDCGEDFDLSEWCSSVEYKPKTHTEDKVSEKSRVEQEIIKEVLCNTLQSLFLDYEDGNHTIRITGVVEEKGTFHVTIPETFEEKQAVMNECNKTMNGNSTAFTINGKENNFKKRTRRSIDETQERQSTEANETEHQLINRKINELIALQKQVLLGEANINEILESQIVFVTINVVASLCQYLALMAFTAFAVWLPIFKRDEEGNLVLNRNNIIIRFFLRRVCCCLVDQNHI